MQPNPMRIAVEARDVQGMIDTLAPDVVFRSPLISATFEGREQVADLFRALADAFLFEGSTYYTNQLTEGDTVVLVFSVNVNGQPVQGVDLLKHDDEGKIKEMTVFLRPLPGATAVAQALSPRLAGRGSRVRSAFAGLGTRP